MLATVVEDPFAAQPQGNTLDGIDGGTMGADHPVSWCKDYQGGRSFYTALGNTAARSTTRSSPAPEGRASAGAAGAADPVYSDCGATVLRNYQQTKICSPPNLNEPIGFDQLPDGRMHPDRAHRHGPPARPGHGHDQGHRRLRAPASDAAQLRIYTDSEDGLYGPAVDNEFATNKWVYLFYSPLDGDRRQDLDRRAGDPDDADDGHPTGQRRHHQDGVGSVDRVLPALALQVRRRCDLEFASPEQQIMRVPVNR